MYFDAHLHLAQSSQVFPSGEYFAVSSCHSKEDFDFLFGQPLPKGRSGLPAFANAHSCALLRNSGLPRPAAFASYGIHPQKVAQVFLEEKNSGHCNGRDIISLFSKEFVFLEELLKEEKIIAIGECGLDYFTSELKESRQEQMLVFQRQIELSQKYCLPLVLHLRKSMNDFFAFSKDLKKLPAVIFHSFPGSLQEAFSILNHKINGYFSFGKPLLNGKKSALDCVKNLPIERILLETDSPYQTLKGEKETFPKDIEKVYRKTGEIRSIKVEELSLKVQENFVKAFNLSHQTGL